MFLVGFMGCGKTTVGRFLAERLEVPFVDLDEEIERAESATIPEIFERRGEVGFRATETRALADQVVKPPSVVATGGGLFTVEANRRHIEQAGGCTVFLDVPWELIERRISATAENRPLWREPARARLLYEARLPTYRLADVVVSPGGDESPADVAEAAWCGLSEASCVT